MAGYRLLKRKGVGVVDQIGDDFSLSSPATKIRRLDCALPPIVEEEDQPVTVTATNNEERALVLFKPLHPSSSSFSLALNSDLISQFNHQQLPWSKQRGDDYYYHDRLTTHYDKEEEEEEGQNGNNNGRLAIVPWVPQQQPSSTFDDDLNNNIELMEADEIEEEGEGMEVEQEEDTVTNSSISGSFHHPTMVNLQQVGGGVTEGFHQQHCLLPPHLPQNTSTPITWTR